LSALGPFVVLGPLLAALGLWAASAWRERNASPFAAALLVAAEAVLLGVTLFVVPGALAAALGVEQRIDASGLLDITVLAVLFVPALLMALHFRRLANCSNSLLWTWDEDQCRGKRSRQPVSKVTARYWALNATFIVLALSAPYIFRALWIFELLDYSATLANQSRTVAVVMAGFAIGSPLLVMLGFVLCGSDSAAKVLRASCRLFLMVVCATLLGVTVMAAMPNREDIHQLRILWWDLSVFVALGAFVRIGWRHQALWVEAEAQLLKAKRDAALAAAEVANAERLKLEAETASLLTQVDLDAVMASVELARAHLKQDAHDPCAAASLLTSEIQRLRARVTQTSG